MNARNWRSAAACRDTDPEVFFPTAESGPVYEAQVATAKAVCAGCPARAECLDEALTRIPDGIAGGLTPEERRARRESRVGVRATAVLGAGLRRGARRSEAEAAGRVLLAAGRPVREVARKCGLSERTAARWGRRNRDEAERASAALLAGQVSRGGHRGSPADLPQPRKALAGTRAAEGISL
jgi:Transcription factor WhiB/Helix-turn-helix domain